LGENRPVPEGLRPGIRAAALLPLPIVRTMGAASRALPRAFWLRNALRVSGHQRFPTFLVGKGGADLSFELADIQ
jgi:hypothetical protein